MVSFDGYSNQDVIYDYNLDGSLKRETIGEDSVQGRDYTYTLLGQIKGINHPSLDGSKDPGKDGQASTVNEHVAPDAFGMAFSYHEDDFDRSYNATASPFNDADASLLGVPNDLEPKDLYSGLIGAWSYKTLATGDANVLRDGALVGERCLHDKLGRLRADTTYLYNSGWVSDGDGGWGARFQHDPNSNMLRMERWSMTDATTSAKHDDATLALVSNESNAMATIDDQGSGVAGYDQELDDATTGDIDVDAKGRLTQAEMGTITDATSYTSYDVPRTLTRGTSDVTYVRNAFGEIVRADVSISSTWDHSTYIIPGSVVADQAIYVRDETEGSPEIQVWSIVGLSRIGVHRGTGSTVTGSITHRNIGHTRYELTDHLGSIRAIVSDIKLNVSGSPAADLLSVADYDPYGATRSLRTLALSAEAPYRHAFQGMRLLEGAGGLAEYRTPFRLYDGRTGRWAGLDPVMQPWTSPYEGLGSQPNCFVDGLGLYPSNSIRPSGTSQAVSNPATQQTTQSMNNSVVGMPKLDPDLAKQLTTANAKNDKAPSDPERNKKGVVQRDNTYVSPFPEGVSVTEDNISVVSISVGALDDMLKKYSYQLSLITPATVVPKNIDGITRAEYMQGVQRLRVSVDNFRGNVLAKIAGPLTVFDIVTVSIRAIALVDGSIRNTIAVKYPDGTTDTIETLSPQGINLVVRESAKIVKDGMMIWLARSVWGSRMNPWLFWALVAFDLLFGDQLIDAIAAPDRPRVLRDDEAWPRQDNTRVVR